MADGNAATIDVKSLYSFPTPFVIPYPFAMNANGYQPPHSYYSGQQIRRLPGYCFYGLLCLILIIYHVNAHKDALSYRYLNI